VNNHYKIIVPFYNVEKWIKICIRSIKKQSNKNFQCVLIDDASTDNTISVIKAEIKNDKRFFLLENKNNLGALENIYNAIQFSKPSDEDIIVNLDGDDWFANPNVLDTLNQYYTGDCLITYGSHAIYPGGGRGKFCQSPVPNHIIEKKLFRESPWMTSALRTFKYKLWKKIQVEDLKDSSGNFYKTAWDLAYMFPMLEMAGKRSKFVEEIVYVYNQHDHNDHVIPEKRHSQLKNETEIRKKKKYNRFVDNKVFPDGSYLVGDPRELLTNLRFDILAKTLFIRHKQKKVENQIAKKVYEEHLKVWGDFTERNPPKNGLQDFYLSFEDTFNSIKNNGFEKEKSILPVDSNGNLLNGSHRVATSIYFKKPVVCKESPISSGQLNCSSFYFLNKKDIVSTGLNTEICDEMAIEFLRIHDKNVYMASAYEHCFDRFNELLQIFDKNSVDVVYIKEFSLTENGKINYVTSLYGQETWIGNIGNGLPGSHEQANLSFAAGNKVKAILLYSKDSKNILKSKQDIRDLIGVGKPSIHITDTYEEAFKSATTCFHNPTLKFMNEAKKGFFNEVKIKNFVKETIQVFDKTDLQNEDFCVGGSAIYGAYGIRDFNDFDIIHLDSKTGIPFTNNVSSHNNYLNYYDEKKDKLIFDRESYIYLHGIKFLSINSITKMKLNRGESKDFRDIKLSQDVISKPNMNIVILAAGPPKKNRNRHLELFNNQPLIDTVIDNCTIEKTNLHIVVNKDNKELLDHLKTNHPNANIAIPEDEKIRSTFKSALACKGDCLMVAGDLKNFTKQDIQKFVYSEHRSATCHYKIPWGSNIQSKKNGITRRADVGDCISLIAEEHKQEFLSEENYERAKYLFDCFYPNGNQHNSMNEYWYNDVGTFTSFSFFEKIWRIPNCSKEDKKGVVSFKHRIYEDND
jgi:glycosyltransferase involved in cell wall biosynthesis